MINRYEKIAKLVNHSLKLSDGLIVDFTATCPVLVTEDVDTRPIWECPCGLSIEYEKNGLIDINVEDWTREKFEGELPDLTDAQYEEIRKYCEENFDDFE